MTELTGPLISGGVAVMLALLAWVSRRFTREARLLARVERLGRTNQLIPASSQKEIFEVYLLGTVEELNAWVDLEAKALRTHLRSLRGASVILALVVMGVLMTLLPLDSWGVGVGIGVAGAGTWILTTELGERAISHGRRRSHDAVDDRIRQERRAAIRRGEAPK